MPPAAQTNAAQVDMILDNLENKSTLIKSCMSRMQLTAVAAVTVSRRITPQAKCLNAIPSSILLPSDDIK